MRNNHRSGWFLLPGLLALLAAPSPGIAGDRSLDGRVVDERGAGVAGATIMLLRTLGRGPITAGGRGADRPPGALSEVVVASTTSAGDGTFSTLVPVGRYRVAAFKPGYDTDITEVNTAARGRIELRLRELPRIVLGDLPVGAPGENLGLDWILRREPRDVLHERAASVTGAGGAPQDDAGSAQATSTRLSSTSRPPLSRGWLGSILEPLDGEFRQKVSGGDFMGGEGQGARAASARTTSLVLKGVLGDQGTWRFDGLMGRSLAVSGAGSGARQDQRADRMMVGMDYRLGPADDLRAEMRYDTSHYVVDGDGETVDATDQEQRTILVHSRWDRRLAGSARLFVDGSYFETGVRTPPGDSALSSLSIDGPGRDRATDRSWLATGGLSLAPGRHRLELGIRTKVYRYEERDSGILLYNLYDAPTLAEPGERGHAMTLFGSDDWQVAGHYAVNYGLRYHSNLASGPDYVVPRVGMTRAPAGEDGLRFRSMVMFRFDDPGLASLHAGGSGRDGADRNHAGRLGYLLGVERGQEDGLRLAATLSYRPFEEGAGGEGDEGVLVPGTWGDALLFLTDGAAGRHELLLELQRGFGDFKGSLAGSIGRVEGRLTPALEEAPVQVLSFGEVRYYKTRLKAMYGPTETAVQIDYRRVQGGPGADARSGPGDLEYRRVDLVVTQDLPWLRNLANARFKMLMAYQGLLYGAPAEGAQGAPASYGAGSRLTGGVDISF